MSAPTVHPETFPIYREKRERSNLGLVLTGIGLGVAACGWAFGSFDNHLGRQRDVPRQIETGFIDGFGANLPERSAIILFPGFDDGNIKSTTQRLAPYIRDSGMPIGFIDNNTGAFSSEQTVKDSLEFAKTNDLEYAIFVGLSAGTLTAVEAAAAYNEAGIRADIACVAGPFAPKDIYLGQRIALRCASAWSQTGVNFGPWTRLVYETTRTSYEMGFGMKALRRAIEITNAATTPPNSSIFGRARNIFDHNPAATYARLHPKTRLVDIYANKPGGDGTIKNRQAAAARHHVLGDRHHEIAVDGIAHMDIDEDGKLELYGQALREAICWLGGRALTSTMTTPEIESSEAVTLVTPHATAA
ncbi:MAG TPA: hypothetical protein VH144_02105 [Candidatus Saccharimonadales bacterium]|jgi:pimeloyl-ACP methyl ester carboxylesterase|nr:hypothetical protein [Candidatus Saccharimonadales bacterium]